jgi:hypothetical protein
MDGIGPFRPGLGLASSKTHPDLEAETMFTMLTRAAVIAIATAATATTAVAPAHAIQYCDPEVKRTYTSAGSTWFVWDAGTIDNSKSSATLHKSFTHTVEGSFSTTVSGELGITAKTVVTEVNAKFGISATITAKVTTSTTFQITVPPHVKVSYKDGILVRTYKIKEVKTSSTCSVQTINGSSLVADMYTQVKDV